MINRLNADSESAKTSRGNTKSELDNVQSKESSDQNNRLLKIILGVVGVFAVLCGLVALGMVYKLARPYFEPKTQIILEPDYSRVTVVAPSDLETAAQILTARGRSVGSSAISFVATENNQIIGQVPQSIDAETIVGRIVAIGLLEFVDFGETPVAAGTSVRTDFDYQYFPQADGTLWHTVITNNGFESAYVTTDQSGRPAISFTLTKEGVKIFSDFTTNNIGHYLGIVLDKVVISAPQVKGPNTDGRGWIQGSFTQEEARVLAAHLGIKGPLPLPLKIKQVLKNDN